MRTYFVLFMVLCASVMQAQEWSWRRDDGSYLNPSGIFSEGEDWYIGHPLAVGDFNGDGDLELVRIGIRSTAEISEYAPLNGIRHWMTTRLIGMNFGDEHPSEEAEVIDLDGDGTDEIIAFRWWDSPPFCWRTVSSNPWSWERADSLLDRLQIRDSCFEAIFGDYDGDGLLNKVELYLSGDLDLFDRRLMLSEEEGGTWFEITELAEEDYRAGGLLDGDFDHDGDMDFAYKLYDEFINLDDYRIFFAENDGQGITIHEMTDTTTLWAQSGGDVDGDGDWDGLTEFRNFPGLSLVEVGTDADGNLVTQRIERLTVTEFLPVGAFRIDGEMKFVLGVNRRGLIGIPGDSGFESVYRTEEGWQEWHGGLGFSRTGIFAHGGAGDATGDGRADFAAVMRTWSAGSTFDVPFFVNVGDAQADSFAIDTTVSGWFQRALDIEHYSQVNSISIGTMGAEAPVVVAVTKWTGSFTRALLYGVTGDIRDTVIARRTALEAGLPVGIAHGFFTDIDLDGLSEFLTMAANRWTVYFWRGGTWERETGVLPNISSAVLGVADFDNDGDADLISAGDVWWNESDLSVSKGPGNLPRRLSLSAYPNPFNASVRLQIELVVSGEYRLAIYNGMGQEVAVLREGRTASGELEVTWDAAKFSAGIYFAALTDGTRSVVQKMLLLK